MLFNSGCLIHSLETSCERIANLIPWQKVQNISSAFQCFYPTRTHEIQASSKSHTLSTVPLAATDMILTIVSLSRQHAYGWKLEKKLHATKRR